MKEEVRKNIMVAIKGESKLYVKVEPEDSKTWFNITDDVAERIYESLPIKYRENFIGLKKDSGFGFVPIFDGETQKIWDKELDNYINRKTEWCQKCGCE